MPNYSHEHRISTLGSIVNQDLAIKEYIAFFNDYELIESLYDLKTHRAIVRAIKRLKERNEPITMLTVSKFLLSYNIPYDIKEENEILEVFASSPSTKNTFIYYMAELNKNKLKGFRI